MMSARRRSENIKNSESEMKNEIKKEIFDHYNMICRVCTNPAEVPITDKIIDGTIILTAIRTVANISLNEDDYYPKYVCNICLEELKIAFQFKKKCEASDLIFRKALIPETTTGETNKKSILIVKKEISSLEGDVHETHKYDFDDLNTPEKSNSKQNLRSQNLRVKKNKNGVNNMLHSSSGNCIKSVEKYKDTSYNQITEKVHASEEELQETHDYDDDNFDTTETSASIKSRKRSIRSFKCKRCDVLFDNKEEAEKHRRNNGCTYNSCPKCGKLVLNLKNHDKIMHSRTDKYTCHQCGKLYYSSGALRNHMHTHQETKGYFCDHCPYRGKRKSYLVCHMRVHTGEHRYLCSMCPLRFTNISNLRKHQLIHFNKKFECSKCNKTFRQKKHLKEHFDSAHLNIRYRCSICGRDLMSRKKLLTHELRVHKREKHKLFEEVQRIVIGNDNEIT